MQLLSFKSIVFCDGSEQRIKAKAADFAKLHRNTGEVLQLRQIFKNRNELDNHERKENLFLQIQN